jgi:hypothetical protein
MQTLAASRLNWDDADLADKTVVERPNSLKPVSVSIETMWHGAVGNGP